jgi:3-dehydroquinate synthase
MMAAPEHIALVGFMGAGKSAVGAELARTCGLPFVDLDALIVERAGRSISDIFAQSGEPGFRARERSALREVLARSERTVIATGGGTFADPVMRRELAAAARTVYLRASPEALLSRIGDDASIGQRPMLQVADREGSLRRLLQRRVPAYETCELVVETERRSLREVVEDVRGMLAVASGDRMWVRHDRGRYAVVLRPRAGPWMWDEIAHVAEGRVHVVTDDNVALLHGGQIVADSVHKVRPGEGSKSLAQVEALYEALLDVGIQRRDVLVAFGGGVVGDLTGFVAATILRGVAYVQVPTTTLAVVDASVGGKTGVNLSRGKNLVGSFNAPALVLVAWDLLVTQDRAAHVAGLCEGLKMAFTMDAPLMQRFVAEAPALRQMDGDVCLDVLARAVALKAQVVQEDEREVGRRAILNYGHTIGHAIEAGEAYRMMHGDAVALGMMAEAEFAEARLSVGAEVRTCLGEGLRRLGAPTDWRRANVDRAALRRDKKASGESVVMPVVDAVGRCALRRVAVPDLVGWLEAA